MKLVTIPLVFLISLSQAVLTDYANPASEDYCSEYLGRHLSYHDCRNAYDLIPLTELTDFPSDKPALMTTLFSKAETSAPRFRLPQSFSSGDCLIEIDMVPNVDFAMTIWDYQRKAASRVLRNCVDVHGIGGKVVLQATVITLRRNKGKGKLAGSKAEEREAMRKGKSCQDLQEQGAMKEDVLKCIEEAEV